MFSYRHIFHIGNFADVIKHTTLVACVKYLEKKEKPFIVIDTHAGAGKYSTTDPIGRDKMEWKSGLGQVLEFLDKNKYLPQLMQDYVDLVFKYNQGKEIKNIPGSPLLTSMLLRKNDRLWAYELHPTDFKNLEKNFKNTIKKVSLEKSDGFQSYKKILPPISRRGLIFIDPPYEDRGDYKKTIFYLKEGLRKFASGVFVIWLPDIQRYEVNNTLKKFRNLHINNLYHLNVNLKKNKSNAIGLRGSNLIIVNPPFGIESQLEEVALFMESNFTFHE